MDLLKDFHMLLSQLICWGNKKYPQEMSENLSNLLKIKELESGRTEMHTQVFQLQPSEEDQTLTLVLQLFLKI